MTICKMNQNYPKAILELINTFGKVLAYKTNLKVKQKSMAKVLSIFLGPG